MPSYAQFLEFLIIKQEITNCGEIWQLRLPWILRRGRAQERKWQSDCRGKLFWNRGFRSWKIPNQWRVRAVNCGDSTKKEWPFSPDYFSLVHACIYLFVAQNYLMFLFNRFWSQDRWYALTAIYRRVFLSGDSGHNTINDYTCVNQCGAME